MFGLAAKGCGGSGLHTRFDADHGNAGQVMTQGLQGGGGGGVAGGDEGGAAVGNEVPADGEYAATNEVVRLAAVGQVGGVCQINKVGMRQGAGNRREY